MMAVPIDLSLVIPLYDEESNVQRVTSELVELLHSNGVGFEIVLVNNGSHDNTDREIDRMMQIYGNTIVKVVVPANKGFGWGVINGLKACRGRFVGFMGGDLQVEAAETIRIYDAAKNNPATVIKAFRHIRNDGIHRKVLSYLYNVLFRILYQIDVRDVNGTPKIFRAEFLKSLDLQSKRSFFDAELLIKLTFLGCKVFEVPVESKKRAVGSSKVRLSTILELFWDLIRFRFGSEFRRWKRCDKVKNICRALRLANEACKPNVDVFDWDAMSKAGYIYTTSSQLSSRLARRRSMDVILQTGRFQGRSVLDVGCGDGFYTIRFYDHGRPRTMIGLDAADHAIEVANANKQGRALQFVVCNAHELPCRDDSFDLALLQSILHHDDKPLEVIAEAFRVAPEILIHEPNGNNFGLKIIERTSRYHREHHEKSYTSRQFTRYVKQAGGKVVYRRYAGFVPMFCPDWLARTMKAVEPVLEHLPVVKALGCALIILVATRSE